MSVSRLKQLLQKKWKTFFAIPIILSVTLGTSECEQGKAPKFQWTPEIFAADSRAQAIVRQKEDGSLHVIFTQDPLFDEYVCVKKDEPGKAMSAYFKVINQCVKWQSSVDDTQGRK